jgi:hypothetical protein
MVQTRQSSQGNVSKYPYQINGGDKAWMEKE